MRLAYRDRVGGSIYEYKKEDKRESLFSDNADYIQKFFEDIRGLGNVEILKIKGNCLRRVALRGF